MVYGETVAALIKFTVITSAIVAILTVTACVWFCKIKERNSQISSEPKYAQRSMREWTAEIDRLRELVTKESATTEQLGEFLSAACELRCLGKNDVEVLKKAASGKYRGSMLKVVASGPMEQWPSAAIGLAMAGENEAGEYFYKAIFYRLDREIQYGSTDWFVLQQAYVGIIILAGRGDEYSAGKIPEIIAYADTGKPYVRLPGHSVSHMTTQQNKTVRTLLDVLNLAPTKLTIDIYRNRIHDSQSTPSMSLIEKFLASGRTVEEYQQEVYSAGYLTNTFQSVGVRPRVRPVDGKTQAVQ